MSDRKNNVELNENEILIPTLYRIIIKVQKQEKQSKGGIIYTEAAVEKFKLMANEGEIICFGPKAFNYFLEDDRFKHLYPEIGDKVTFIKYAGIEFTKNDDLYRIINDEDVLAISKKK